MRLPAPPQHGVRDRALREKAYKEKTYKPSTPIQIPTRPRSILAPAYSPDNRSLSPDLIFDMSPVDPSAIDSHFPAESNRSTPLPYVHRALKRKTSSSVSLAPNQGLTPPFMYSFPRPNLQCNGVEPDHFAPLKSPDSYFDPTAFIANRDRSQSRRLSSTSFDFNFGADQPDSQSLMKRSYFTSAFAVEDDGDTENTPDSQSCIHSQQSGRGRSRRLSTSTAGRFSALASPASARRERSRRPLSPPPPSRNYVRDEGVNVVRKVTQGAEDDYETHINNYQTYHISDSYEEPLSFEKYPMRRTEDEKRGGRARRGRAGSLLASSVGFAVVVESY